MQSSSDFDINFLEKYDDNNLIFYSSVDKAFYKVPLVSQGYIIGNYTAQKVEADLIINDDTQVFDVKYSSAKNQVLFFIGFVDAVTIKWFDFNTNQTNNFDQSIFSADWLSDSELIGITDIDAPKLVKLSPDGDIKNIITDLPSDPSNIYAPYTVFASSNFAFVQGQESFLVNLSNSEKQEVNLSEGLVVGVRKSPVEAKFIILLVKDQKTQVLLLNSDTSLEEISVIPYLNSVYWTNDGKGLIYVSFDEKTKTYNFNKYTFTDKKNTIINTISQDEGDPSNIIVSNNYLDFILGGNIMAFKIE